MLSICQQTFSLRQKIKFIYFPLYFFLKARANVLLLVPSERATAQALR